MDWTKIQQRKRDQYRCLISLNISKKKQKQNKTLKQYSGLSPDSFKDHQNDLLLNSAFLEGPNEELQTRIKRHKLNWPIMHTQEWAILADQLSKTIQKGEKDKVAKILNFQLQELRSEVRPPRTSFRPWSFRDWSVCPL